MLCRPQALLAFVLGPCFVALAYGQAASAPGAAGEQMERAQRDADKVLMRIRQMGETPRNKPAAKAEAPAAPPRRAEPRRAPPAAKVEARAEPATPAADVVKAPLVTAPAPATALAQPVAPPPAAAPVNDPLVFDFDQPLASFKVNSGTRWGEVRGAQLRLVERQGSGGKAIQAKTPEDSWLGQDFNEPRDWSKKKYLHFQTQSALGFDGKTGLKFGDGWDWCDLRAVAGAQQPNGVTHYRLALDTRACPQLDRSNIRGLHFWVRQGDTFTMDGFRLE